MFTASLNLEALQKSTKKSPRICATKGCEQPVAQTQPSNVEHCPDHSQKKAERPRRAKKARS